MANSRNDDNQLTESQRGAKGFEPAPVFSHELRPIFANKTSVKELQKENKLTQVFTPPNLTPEQKLEHKNKHGIVYEAVMGFAKILKAFANFLQRMAQELGVKYEDLQKIAKAEMVSSNTLQISMPSQLMERFTDELAEQGLINKPVSQEQQVEQRKNMGVDERRALDQQEMKNPESAQRRSPFDIPRPSMVPKLTPDGK